MGGFVSWMPVAAVRSKSPPNCSAAAATTWPWKPPSAACPSNPPSAPSPGPSPNPNPPLCSPRGIGPPAMCRTGAGFAKAENLRRARRLTIQATMPPIGPCRRRHPEAHPSRQPRHSLKISSMMRFSTDECGTLTERAIRVPHSYGKHSRRLGSCEANGAAVWRVAAARRYRRGRNRRANAIWHGTSVRYATPRGPRSVGRRS